MKQIKVNPNNEQYYSKEFVRGFNLGAQRQFEADKADRPQGDVDAVAIFEHEMHNLEQGYITLGEFDERIEPLRHLCYGRPQGKWIRRKYWSEGVGMGESYGFYYECSNCGKQQQGGYYECGMNFCPHCGSRMRRGADDVER